MKERQLAHLQCRHPGPAEFVSPTPGNERLAAATCDVDSDERDRIHLGDERAACWVSPATSGAWLDASEESTMNVRGPESAVESGGSCRTT